MPVTRASVTIHTRGETLSYQKSFRLKRGDEAVSPVVGVMLMLVVTIIIAAVVSAFAGGLTKSTDKAPTANLQVNIVNDGTWGGSTFDVIVLGTSDPIPTKDLKIITDWKAHNGTTGGATITGPNLTGGNTHYSSNTYNSPLGFGPGVNVSGQQMSSGGYYADQSFGNYSLMSGTRMHNSAAGFSVSTGGYGISPSARYQYSNGTYTFPAACPGGSCTDAMQAILGYNWNDLRPGDIVHVKILHIPSGKLIYNGQVAVEG
jgi:FlaG/FlaF family flagellin (archaellin)